MRYMAEIAAKNPQQGRAAFSMPNVLKDILSLVEDERMKSHVVALQLDGLRDYNSLMGFNEQ